MGCGRPLSKKTIINNNKKNVSRSRNKTVVD